MAINVRTVRGQTRALARAYAAVWPPVRDGGRPADRVLNAWLRAHPELGGRDRRLIADQLFELWRWWGWLAPLVPAEAAPATPVTPAAPVAPGETADSGGWGDGPEWARLWLAVAAVAARPPDDAMRYWAATQGGVTDENLARLPTIADPAVRLAAVGVAAPAAAAGGADRRALLPAWALEGIDCPRPLETLIDWLQRRPPLWLRVSAREDPVALGARLAAAGGSATPHPRLPRALNLGHIRLALAEAPDFRAGHCEAQDLASQAILAVCAPRPGERWLDACAGAGGKTLGLAEAVGASGHVLALDVRPDARRETQARARRARLQNIQVRAPAAGATPLPPSMTFDGVLVDAPCSGAGVWRRAPWARWQLAAADVPRHAARQGELLAAYAPRVRPGGVLLYATCSLFTAENGAVVSAFLATHPDFTPDPFPHPLLADPTPGHATFWPWEGDQDIMFVARLRRQ